MENYCINEQLAFVEELLGVREMENNNHYTNQAYLNAINGCFSLESLYSSNGNPNLAGYVPNSNSGFENYSSQFAQTQQNYNISSSSYAPFGDELSPPDFTVDSSSSINFDAQTVPYGCAAEAENHFSIGGGGGEYGVYHRNLDIGGPCKMEPLPEMPCGGASFNMGFLSPQVSERKCRVKKLNGQPSKNLMAERRRRKRLNDRLSMLRSVVPKISKMDRTSILGDTIDYMKELLERINGLQKEMHLGSNQLSLMTIFNDVKPNEIVVRNSPKFDVERRNADTRIEICCGGKPGLLLSTVTTLEALGLEIQQCVISCFNEFSVQASCSEEMKKRGILDSEDIRQALLRNAGYGEKCL